ncbi:MAG: glycoside hydrolase family 1 protein, partial [Solimonas sp.]
LGVLALSAPWFVHWQGPLTVTAVRAPLPADFIWGVSASGWQSEGGRVDSNYTRANDKDSGQDRYGTSVDFRHRYREDVALARSLGINTFRIGISWARVEPRKGEVDEKEMAYYDDLIMALKEAGIQPLVTLDHFVYPGWVADQGGWSNERTVDDFVAYSRRIAERYHADVSHWLTFNEAFFNIIGIVIGDVPDRKTIGLIADHMVAAHRQVYDLIHTLDPQADVSSNFVWIGDTPASRKVQQWTDSLFLDRIADKNDVIAFDYYSSNFFGQVAHGKQNWGWNPNPPGLYRALRALSERFPDKPLLICEAGMSTENGKPRADGIRREDVLRDQVYWIQRAREDGINVIGYMVWSLTDNFEWGSYTPRFGLYTVNVLTDPKLECIPTPAVAPYREIVRAGGVPPDYIPVLGTR